MIEVVWVEALKKVFQEEVEDDTGSGRVMQKEMDKLLSTMIEESKVTGEGLDLQYDEIKLMDILEKGECVLTLGQQGSERAEGEQRPKSDNLISDYALMIMQLLKFSISLGENHPRLHYTVFLKVYSLILTQGPPSSVETLASRVQHHPEVYSRVRQQLLRQRGLGTEGKGAQAWSHNPKLLMQCHGRRSESWEWKFWFFQVYRKPIS